MKKIFILTLLGLSLAGCKNPFRGDPFSIELAQAMNPNIFYSDNAEPVIAEIKIHVKANEIILSGISVDDDSCKLLDWKLSGYKLEKNDVFTVHADCDPSTINTVKVETDNGDFEYQMTKE